METLCAVLAVSRSGYYAWRTRGPSGRSRHNAGLTERIRQIHTQSGRTYGSPRVHRELLAAGTACGRHRVARLMHAAGLRATQGRRFRPSAAAPVSAVAPHRLQRRFHRARTGAELNRRWATDATVIPTREGWLHLIAVLDLGSRQVVGWAAGPDLTGELARQALSAAVAARRPPPGLLVHSDQGTPFVATTYQAVLAVAGASASMSRRGNCWDNAVVESFFHTYKDERRERLPYPSFPAARADLFDFIEVWYNRKRRHSTLNYQSPMEYERSLSETTSS